MELQSQELRKLISNAIRHKKQQDRRDLTFRQIAKELHITEARLSSYHTGSRIPPQAFAVKMAKCFLSTEAERKQFVAALDKIRTDAREAGRASRGSLLERLASGEPLRVGTFRDEPFSGTKDDFFDHVFYRFSRLSGLVTTTVELSNLDIRKALWENELDLCLSSFASVDRSLMAHFWTTPIRLNLGAVIHRKHEGEKNRVKRILSLEEQQKGHRIRPIVVKGEVGAIYCKERLGFEEADVVREEQMDPVRLAEHLRRKSKATEIPVVVIDEYASFQVLRELGNEGIPVLPLTTREEIQKDSARREMPQYFLSFACSRRREELRDMIDQSFWLFLSTELNTTASALASLYENLMAKLALPGGLFGTVVDYYFDHPREPHVGEMEALRFQQARNWTLYALALDRKSIDGYPSFGMPWRPILERAREIIHADLVGDLETIRHQINFCSHYQPDRPLSYDRFRKLCEIFDLPVPELNYAQKQYVFEDHDMVLATIQNALLGRQVPALEPRVEVVSPLTEEASPIVSGFIGETSKMYFRELGGQNNATDQINQFLDPTISDPVEKHQMLKKEFTGAVLASHGKHESHYIGCACLRPYKGSEGKDRELELCYLFVREAFRNLKIARYLLYWAHRAAKEQGYTALIFEALPQYFEGMLYLEKRDFTRTSRKGFEGRIVLEYPTAKVFPPPKKEAPITK